MLMALLPLTGWAQLAEPTYPVDLSSGWKIQFVAGATATDPGTVLTTPTATYTGSSVAPQVRLYNEGSDKYIPESKLNVSWSPSPVVDVNGGTAYVVTVTGKTQYTYDELPAADKTKKFFVLTAANDYVTGKTPALHGNFTYNGTETPVITNEPEAEFGTILYSVNGGEWSSTIPTAKWPGEYAVKVKVIGTDNYAGINENESATLGTLTIAGTPITNYVAPVKKADMDFAWANNAAKEQELVTAGSVALDEHSDVPGIIKYGYSADGPWSADIPKKANVGDYTIYWKIEGQGGYADKAAALLGTVKIKAIEPTITSVATGQTGLVYGGDASAAVGLLSAPAVVTDGAIAKYKVDYKAPGADYPATPSTVVLAYDAVQGKAAGTYKITTLVETAGNYTTVTSPTTIEVTIAQAKAFTSKPTAKEKLVWDYNNGVVDQVLINPAVGAVSGKVQYAINPAFETDWKTNVNEIKANRANDYVVKYRVVDPNYEAVPATAIEGVKISRKVVSVIVNDITKTYNNATDLTNDNTTIDNGGTARFTYATLLPGTATYFDALNTADSYVYVSGAGAPKDYKDGGYPGVVTIDPTVATTGLNAIASTNNFDYEFNVLPGKLTINKAVVTVTENGDPNTSLKTMFGEHKNISDLYTVTTATTISTAEQPWKKVGGVYQKPVLKSEADDVEGEPEAGDYALSFVPGTLTDNYMMSTAGANHDGYVITAGHKFVITPDPARKVIITVLPHTQKYTGVAESWANIEEGKDYVVSGLITGDEVTGVTFTRSESDKFDVKYDGPNVVGYTLSADNATIVKDGTPVDMTAKYPGGIVYSNSTFTILPVELTATVDQQTITESADDETKANAAIDKNAWNVEGLVGPDATTGKSVLNGAVAVNITTSHSTDETKKKATLGAEGLYGWGLELTIHNGNYTLKDGSKYGILRVITDQTLELDPTNADLADNIKAAAKACADSRKNADTADDVFYTATFANKTLKADTWYTMVLPFAVKATELVNSVKDAKGNAVFTIANRLSSTSTTGNLVFKLEMKEIPANEPFLIKTAEDVNLQNFSLGKRIIIDATPESPAYDGNKIVGTYTNIKIQCPAGSNVLKWLVNEETEKPSAPGTYYDVNNWKVCRDYEAPINALEAYLKENRTVEANAAHPTIITVEDFDGQTTSIKTLNADTMKAYAAEGWYTLDGIKLQSAPTEKGIYINNGKKVVLK